MRSSQAGAILRPTVRSLLIPGLLVVVGLLLPAAAAGEPTTLLVPARTSGLTVPGTSVAIEDGPASSVVNPAGLGMQRGLGLLYLHQEGPHGDGVDGTDGDGLYLGTRILGPLTFGVSLEWLHPHTGPFDTGYHRRTTWALALGNELISLGASAHVFSAGLLDDRTAWDAGLLLRPAPFLSVGFVARDLDASTVAGVRNNRRYTGAVAVRPFGKWLTLAVDGEVLGSENKAIPHGFDSMVLGGTARLRVIRGATLFTSFAHRLDGGPGVGQLGLSLDLNHFGILGTPLARSSGDRGAASGWVIGAQLRGWREEGLDLAPGAEVARVDLGQSLRRAGGLRLFPTEARDPMVDAVEGLAALGRDPTVSAVVLELRDLPPMGLAHAYDLRQAILALRQRGKPVIALLHGASDASYYLASAADRLIASPESAFFVNGFASRAEFFADTLSLIGVTVEAVRVGAYKTAPDALTAASVSKEQEEVMRSILADWKARYVRDLAAARGLEPAQIEEILQVGIRSAEDARRVGLVDDVLYPDQLADELAGIVGRPVRLVRRGLRPSPWEQWSAPPEIAVIPITGTITGGVGDPGGFSLLETTGARDVVQALQAASGDPSIRSILLRIDSGGGDAAGSRLIWRAVEQAAAKKPVIVAMGGAAASGGYYAAAAATKVHATPATLTGSIGIFWIKPSFEGLLEKLKVGLAEVKEGEQADITGIVRRWTPEERASVQAFIDAAYRDFLEAVATGRDLPVERVDELARGRVWTGAQAFEHALVDDLGGLPGALRDARLAAGLDEDAIVRFRVYRRNASLFSAGLEAMASPPLPPAVERLLHATLPLPLLLPNQTGVWALAPFAWRAP